MKQKLIEWAIGALISLVFKLKHPAPFVLRARELATAAEKLDASGEYKRHTVYAQLIKEFPQVAKRVLSLAIEQGLP